MRTEFEYTLNRFKSGKESIQASLELMRFGEIAVEP